LLSLDGLLDLVIDLLLVLDLDLVLDLLLGLLNLAFRFISTFRLDELLWYDSLSDESELDGYEDFLFFLWCFLDAIVVKLL